MPSQDRHRRRSDRAWMAALAVAAGLRVGLLAAAFPFFHSVDEHQHVDTVHRWSRGQLPGPEATYLGEPVVGWALRFGSFEYLEADPLPPFSARPSYRPDLPWAAAARRAYEDVLNQEFESPPVYYATAALWYRIGELAFDDLDLLLWLRAFNVLVLVLLVMGSHAWLRRQHPDDPLLYRGVPALLAFFPQDAFYGVSPDGLCALVGGVAFVATVSASDAHGRSLRRDAAAGLAAGAAFLAKYTNVVYVGVLGLAFALRAARHGRDGSGRQIAAGGLAAAGAAIALPALWLARNQAVLGDALGTARKVAHLEWTQRPWSLLLDHPVFGPAGFAGWLSETLAVFWRGEFRWLGETLSWPWLDACLTLGSLVLLAAGATRAVSEARRGRFLELLALAAVVSGFATLAVLSARFSFADWGNPTRSHPYFTEGRLILGVLLPFAVVFVRGIGTLCAWLPGASARAPWWLLAAWITLVTVSDLWLAAPAFASPWNWLHAGATGAP